MLISGKIKVTGKPYFFKRGDKKVKEIICFILICVIIAVIAYIIFRFIPKLFFWLYVIMVIVYGIPFIQLVTVKVIMNVNGIVGLGLAIILLVIIVKIGKYLKIRAYNK